jgi:hypothetical protein
MQDVPGLDADASPFERLRKFAGMIISVPRIEADNEMKKAGLNKKRPTTSRRSTKEDTTNGTEQAL